MPVQIADVKRVLMSVHQMNQAGLVVVLDKSMCYFKEKSTGKIIRIKYDGGRYYFDIWTKAAPEIKTNNKGSDDMDVDAVKQQQITQRQQQQHPQQSNIFWILSTDEEESGFRWQDMQH